MEITSQVGIQDYQLQTQIILLVSQFSAAVLSFIVIPAYFMRKYESKKLNFFFNSDFIKLNPVMITIGLTLSVMVVNSLLIEWNLNIDFPESISAKLDYFEEQGRLMTEYLTDFHSLPYFLLVLIVVAIVPAIGEELLFRGLIQKYLQGIWGNPHVAIWVTAMFFSAFHMQFYGFVPRMALGAFFGYLFYVSGNLWYASIAHFINNGFTLLMIYLFQKEMVDYDIESTETVSAWSTLTFAIIGAVLFVLFKKQFHITDNLRNE
ncbi:CPBP family intramembrane glutamic endopeptidase [Reichenbachiella sp.]|uniref:CPBP family intramembrane glutamic endopeptidase n=1 Tax=Reichenbachiella sp. TaxID=2184521 RepID=UPI003B5B64CF